MSIPTVSSCCGCFCFRKQPPKPTREELLRIQISELARLRLAYIIERSGYKLNSNTS